MRTFQALMNIMRFGMTVDDAINAPDFFLPRIDAAKMSMTVNLPTGRFPKYVLEDMGYGYEEFDGSRVRFGGEGLWVGISRDPKTGELRAASHNRNNSAAVAY